VVRLVLRGAGNQAIAGALSIGEHTVETHLSHIYDKLDVRARGPMLSRFSRETFYAGIDDPPEVNDDRAAAATGRARTTVRSSYSPVSRS
jgi:hypothetical protein